ncbi:MAG: hypothetical protein ACE5I9_00100 [Candidatus Methylomirabilales bacterium]
MSNTGVVVFSCGKFGATADDVLKGPQFTWWRQMHAERRGGEIPLCRECPDWPYRSWAHNWTKVIRTSNGRRQAAIEATEV